MGHNNVVVHLDSVFALMMLAACLAIWPFGRKGQEYRARDGGSLAEEALRLAMLGRLSEAKRRFEEAEAAGARDLMLYYNWGLVLSHMGEHVPACEMYRMALEMDERCADALINWGVSLAALGRHEEACEQYKRAEQLDSHIATIYFNWGTSLFAMGNLEEAREKFERAVLLDANDAQARYNLGICLYHLGRPNEAEEQLRAFLDRARGRFPEQRRRAEGLIGKG